MRTMLSRWTPNLWNCTRELQIWLPFVGFGDRIVLCLGTFSVSQNCIFTRASRSNCLMWPLWFDHMTSSVVCASNPSISHFNPRSLWSEKMLRWQHRPTSIHFSRRKTFCINFPILHFFLIFLLADSELAECCIIEVVDHRCGEAVNLAAVTLWSWTH